MKPPSLRSAKGAYIVRFKTAYEHYVRKVAVLNAGNPPEKAVKEVSRKSCIDPDLIMSLTENDEFAPAEKVEDVTEDRITIWLDELGRCSSENVPDQLRDALSRVKFEVDQADPKGAARAFFSDLNTELRRNRVDHIKSESPKQLIQLLIPKLEPAVLRGRLKDAFEFWSEEQKNNLKHFRDTTASVAAECARFEKTYASSKSEATFSKGKRGAKRGPTSDVDKERPVAKHGSEKVGASRKDKERRSDWKEKCLNPACDEVHPLIRCPKTGPELRERLLAEYRAKKAKNAKPKKFRPATAN